MAFTKVNINYSGKEAEDLLIRPLFAERTVAQRAGWRTLEGYKSKAVWHNIGSNAKITAASCVPNFDGDVTLTQREVELCRLSMALEICHDELLGTYRELQYRAGQQAQKMSDDELLLATVIDVLTRRFRTQLNDIWLNGQVGYYISNDKDYLELCDGLLYKLEVTAGVEKVTGTAITSANVLAEMEKVYNKIPSHLLYNAEPDNMVAFCVAPNVMSALTQALAVNGVAWWANQNPQAEIAPVYLGRFPLVVQNELPDNTIIATPRDNVALFFDTEADTTGIRIVDVSQYSTKRTWECMLRVATAIDVMRYDNVVYYRP
jgi:hypothetical protein